MAVTISTNYVGKEAGAIFTSALALPNTSIGKGVFTVNDKVKGKGSLRLIKAGSNVWATDDGTFSDTGDLALTTKALTLDYKKVNLVIKKKDLAVDWAAFDMSDGATGTVAGETLAKIHEEVVNRVGMGTDVSIWSGILTEAAADATVVDVSLASLTEANVIDNMQKMVKAYAVTDSADAEDSVILMNGRTRAILNGAQIGKGQLDARGEKTADYGGIGIESFAAMPNDVIIMTRRANLGLLADTLTDLMSFSIIDQSPITGANALHIVVNAGFKASYTDGTQFVYGKV